MNPLVKEISTEREQRRDDRRRRRNERRRLVKPDRTSRPSLMLGKDQRRIPESFFTVPLMLVWTLLVGILVIEAFRRGATSVVYEKDAAAAALLFGALACMALIFTDVASYRPRLFALADRRGTKLIVSFKDQSGDFRAVFREFKATPLTSLAQVPGRQEKVLSAINQYIEVGSMRTRIACRVLNRLGALLAALALVAYSLSALTHGDVVQHAAANAGLAEHLYFVVAQAMTIGFGDLHPRHGPWGYVLMGLSVLTMAAIVYFVLSEIIASQAQFRSDLRTAVERFVVSNVEF